MPRNKKIAAHARVPSGLDLGEKSIAKLRRRLGLDDEVHYNEAYTTTAPTTTLVARITNPAVAQGDGVQNRNGSAIRISRAELRLNFAPAATQANCTSVRVIVTRFKQPSAPGAADVLNTTTDITAPLHNLIREKGIEVMMDQVYSVGTPAGTSPNVYIHREWTGNWPMTWTNSDTTGSASNLVEGGWNVWYMCDVVSTAAPVTTGTLRVYFTDS